MNPKSELLKKACKICNYKDLDNRDENQSHFFKASEINGVEVHDGENLINISLEQFN